MRSSKRTIESVGEFGLIDQIRRWIPPAGKEVIRGIGEDAAILSARGPFYALLAIDTIVEDVDFKRGRATPQEIGWKALAINLSDLAAMGGRPKAAVVSLVLPRKTPLNFVQGFYDGIRKLARRFQVSIVGGDLSRGPRIVSSIAVLGESRRKWTVLRRGARIGELLCVTGELGGSILGKHLNFMPRLGEGEFLARHGASSMIDVSDGLRQDLTHLARESQVGFIIDERNIPVSQAALMFSRGDRRKALEHAFCDGEDFELLFTMSSRNFSRLEHLWTRRFSTRLTAIGRVVKKKFADLGAKQRFGFQHF